MSTFSIELEVGNPEDTRWEKVTVPVDTGSAYTVVPRAMLERLSVKPFRRARFRLADGQSFDQEIGQTWIRLDGNSVNSIVAFGEEGEEPLLGAYALEGLLLAVDPVGERLVPTESLRLKRTLIS